jgi:hypothetical protein
MPWQRLREYLTTSYGGTRASEAGATWTENWCEPLAFSVRGFFSRSGLPIPTAMQFLRSQAQPRSVRPGFNPGDARVQSLHCYANALADGRNGERNSGHQ